MSYLNPCQDGNVHTHGKTKQLKKNLFKINSQTTNQEICILLTSILKIKRQKYKEQKNETFKAKDENMKQTSCIKVNSLLEIKLQKYIF